MPNEQLVFCTDGKSSSQTQRKRLSTRLSINAQRKINLTSWLYRFRLQCELFCAQPRRVEKVAGSVDTLSALPTWRGSQALFLKEVTVRTLRWAVEVTPAELGNQHGILAMLDEERLRPGVGTTDTSLERLNQVCATHRHLESRMSRSSRFLIRPCHTVASECSIRLSRCIQPNNTKKASQHCNSAELGHPVSYLEREGLQKMHLEEVATVIQKVYRGWRCRARFILMKKSQVIIAAWFRRYACRKYREQFPKLAYDEKLAARELFEGRKVSYPASVEQPFKGIYFQICKKINDSLENIIFAEIITKFHRTNGRCSARIFLLTKNEIVLAEKKYIKSKIPLGDITKVSMSSQNDGFFAVHLRKGSGAAGKGDFLFRSDHVIELATKLYHNMLSQTHQKLNIEISDEFLVHFRKDTVCVMFVRGNQKKGNAATLKRKSKRLLQVSLP